MDVLNLTKITLAWELYEQEVPKSHIASRLNINRETAHLWIKGIQEFGLVEFLDKYACARKGERAKGKTDGLLKSRIYKLRDENRNCCGQKIKEFLADEYGIVLSHTTIYKILSEKYQLRSKWKKNQVRGPVPKAEKPREVIQMDSVDFGEVFAFTGVDIFSKEISVKLYPSLTAKDALLLLGEQEIIDKGLSQKMGKAADFRNRVVHGYNDFDYTLLFRDFKNNIRDLKDFAKQILEFLEKNS